MSDATVNEILRDMAIRHAIDTHRYSNSVVVETMRTLMQSDSDLISRLQAAIRRIEDTGRGSFTVQRLDEVLAGVNELTTQTYVQASRAMQTRLREMADVETYYHSAAFRAALPGEVMTQVTTPSAEMAYASAMAKPFQGRLLSEWFDGLNRRAQQRLRDIIAQGFTRGATVDEMIIEVRGTRANAYQDGALQIDRREAEAVVRTAISHVASVAREEFYAANDDLIENQMWVSTLDNRTTPMCQIRDGLVYTLDGEPVGHDVPWLDGPGDLHWNCRSISVPIIKSAMKLGIELPPGERAAMGGAVPSAVKYGEWIKSQSAEVQDQVLGPIRAEALRSGELSYTKFFNNKGEQLSIDELRARYPRKDI